MTVNLRSSLNTGLNNGLRQSISGGVNGLGFFRTASLDLQFASKKTLNDRVSSSNLIAFTRASSGTYVNGDGLIKTTPVNLKTNSEEVDTFDKTEVTVTANQFAAPNGTLTADKVDITTANSLHHAVVGESVSDGVSSTTSVYVKGISNVTQVQLRTFITGGRASAVFDLVDVTSEAFGTSNFIFTDSSITPAGDDWYRISLTFTTDGASPGAVFLCFTDGNADPDVDRNGQQFVGTNESMAVWGAQVEKGLVMNDYIPTTSTISGAPRFDHDPATGESLGLLIEEARTNLVTYSDLSSDVSTSDVTNTASTEVNPQGVASCRRLLSDAGFNSDGHRFKKVGGTAGSSNNITVSAFVKKDTHRYVYIGWGGTSNSFTALFDIEPSLTGDRLLGQGGKGTYTNIDAGYENYANGWVRIFASGTTSGTDGFTLGLSPSASPYTITTGSLDGTEAIFVHGAQYEDNVTFPTSYISTEGSTVTRAADVAEITGTNFSSFYNQSEGAVFVEAKASGTSAVVGFDDGTTAERWRVGYAGSNNSSIIVVDGGVVQTNINTSSNSTPYNQFHKLAGAIAANNLSFAHNGILSSDSSVSVPVVNALSLGTSIDVSGHINGHIKRLAYFPTRLLDATLQNITT